MPEVKGRYLLILSFVIGWLLYFWLRSRGPYWDTVFPIGEQEVSATIIPLCGVSWSTDIVNVCKLNGPHRVRDW